MVEGKAVWRWWGDSAWCMLGDAGTCLLRKKAKIPLRGHGRLLIHCMLVEKGSLAGFLSALSNKSLLSEAFTALSIKISIAAHTPRVSEAVVDWCLLA